MSQVEQIAKITQAEAFDILENAADRVAPQIARAFLASADGIRDSVSEQQVIDLLEAGDLQAVASLASPSVTDDNMQVLAAAIGSAVVVGGEATARAHEPVTGPQGRVSFVFNVANPKVNRYAQEIAGERVREIGNDVRAVINETVRDGVVRGDNPITTARRVRGSIGLTVRQEQAVDNYRRALQQGNSVALQRALRDKRFDPTISRAIRNNQPLKAAQIDRMVERYREKYLKYRAETIGRTESIASVQGAQDRMIDSYIEEGKIDSRQIRRFWKTARDGNVREAHSAVPRMNENGVMQGQPFQTPLGPMMFPGDPGGIAANRINCRCTAFTRVISLELLDD